MAQQYFSPLVENAIRLASYWHKGQMRKGGEFNYFTHLSAVAAILAQAGFEEEIVAAGYCHDLLEDTKCSKEEIKRACGQTVLDIVETVTEEDDDDHSQTGWEKRKRKYIEEIKAATWPTKAVATADKIHNLQTLMAALDEYGLGYFDYFHVGPEKKLWFEDHFCMMLHDNWEHSLVEEYNQLVDNFVEFLEELDAKGKNEKLELDLSKTDFGQPQLLPKKERVKTQKNEQVLNEIRTMLEQNLLNQGALIKFIKLQSQKIDNLTKFQKTIQARPEPKRVYVDIKKPALNSPKRKVAVRYLKDAEYDYLLPATLQLGVLKKKLTNSLLQKNLKINYLLAHRILKELKRLHVIDRADSTKPRVVNIPRAEELMKKMGK
jgi:guanosine-3',5'-bis(diphosphate) 3'-pyrophosphohydrolase